MKRVITATCLAASFAVGLGAQSTGTAGTTGTTPPDSQGGGQRGGGPRTVVGCLRAGDTAGTFMLTDVTMQGGRAGGGPGATAGGTTAGGTGTATGTATGGTTATAGAPGGGQAMPPMSIMLTTADTSIDLKAHVGHKIEVTGTMAGGRGRGADAGAAGSTGTATGTTAATGTATGTTATTGTAATGTTTGTGTTAAGTTASGGTATATGTPQGGGRGPRNMTVTSVRMISESCN